jgi:pimeloyl-ACP methyl ester carboxylesterase
MLSVRLDASPLAGGAPATIAYRAVGAGPPLVILHGGWGYDAYPFDVQTLAARFRVLIPDRAGYGRSTPVSSLPLDFHRRAMLETAAFLDALGIGQAIWWGHSDGAVIAALAGLEIPDRTVAVLLEALHLYKDKPRSRAFFEQMVDEPERFGRGLTATLINDHGADRWREVLRLDGQAWLDLAAGASAPDDDLYDSRLPRLAPPALLIHGGRDPRTEPGEWAAIRHALPTAAVDYHPDAGHSPHCEAVSAGAVVAAALAFLEEATR